MAQDDLAGQLADHEQRLRALEDAARPADRLPGKWWLLDALAARGPSEARDGVSGRVAYGGHVSTPGTGDVVWQLEHNVASVLATDLGPVSLVLGALGHPLRLEILRQLMLGVTTAAELQDLPAAGTSGQLQHHLRELRAAGLVTQPRRGHYAVVTDRVVPLLTVIAAAAGRTAGAAPVAEAGPADLPVSRGRR